MSLRLRFALTLALAAPFALHAQPRPASEWRQVLDKRLPVYGHRNWIVIADSAYPLQSGAGIETIVSDEGQIETVRHVLQALSHVKHVRPVVYTDKELSFVPEADANGVQAYRQLLKGLFSSQLPGQNISTIPHDDVIKKLDEASKAFNVLIIKTNMTLPYTSVFLELRAAYWGDDAEERMRKSIR